MHVGGDEFALRYAVPPELYDELAVREEHDDWNEFVIDLLPPTLCPAGRTICPANAPARGAKAFPGLVPATRRSGSSSLLARSDNERRPLRQVPDPLKRPCRRTERNAA